LTTWKATLPASNGTDLDRSVIVHRQNWYDARELAAVVLQAEPGRLRVVELKETSRA